MLRTEAERAAAAPGTDRSSSPPHLHKWSTRPLDVVRRRSDGTSRYVITCVSTFRRDGATVELTDRRYLHCGDREEVTEFDSPRQAWEWLGIDPAELPADEVVEGADRFVRRYRVDTNELTLTVVVTDEPTTELWAHSRITERRFRVQKA